MASRPQFFNSTRRTRGRKAPPPGELSYHDFDLEGNVARSCRPIAWTFQAPVISAASPSSPSAVLFKRLQLHNSRGFLNTFAFIIIYSARDFEYEYRNNGFGITRLVSGFDVTACWRRAEVQYVDCYIGLTARGALALPTTVSRETQVRCGLVSSQCARSRFIITLSSAAHRRATQLTHDSGSMADL